MNPVIEDRIITTTLTIIIGLIGLKISEKITRKKETQKAEK